MSSHRINNLHPLFQANVTSIFIYGTGTFARAVLDVLSQHNILVRGFLDHSPRQSAVHDLPVCTPNDLPREAIAGAAVILGIHNRDADIASITARLKSLGYAQIVTPVDLYDYFASELGERFWLTGRAFYAEHEREIETAARLFVDPTSRCLFDALLRFRLTGDYSLLPRPDTEHQYFPSDMPAWTSPLRFVDCGAYDGDTLSALLRAGYQFQALAAFEPDQENFRKLSTYISQNQKSFPNAALFPCGVYSSSTQLIFETGSGEGSKVSETGTTVIQCTSLDESIPTFAPDLIKMDIEGPEADAILGAKQLIRNYRPGLAIAIYHAPAHLWEIPLCVHQMAEADNFHYTYYLRAHAQNGFENIFYAVPERTTE